MAAYAPSAASWEHSQFQPCQPFWSVMAPRLNAHMHELILAKIRRGDSNKKIAEDISSHERKVSPHAVRHIRKTYLRYGTATTPAKRTGPDPKITPLMQDSLYIYLANDQGKTREEMATFLFRKFGVDVSVTAISRALKNGQITWKTMRRVALQQLPELKHFYWYLLKQAGVKPRHCIFIDESGINPPDVLRKNGWARSGITPIQRARFQKENRVQILSAYTLKGIKQSRVYYGSTDTVFFEDYIEQLLHSCGRFPDDDESVLIMDNVSFHFSDKIERLCNEAGVRRFLTAPYTPRTNPIEENFGVLKTTTRSKHKEQVGLRKRSFIDYVKACIVAIKDRSDIAEGHFRNAGFYIKP
ncbi:hypothetical protein PWT90_07630 [Aphanocladium album]|nr:hypothetical protein PWT90_07630 [Aphanocladium album]